MRSLFRASYNLQQVVSLQRSALCARAVEHIVDSRELSHLEAMHAEFVCAKLIRVDVKYNIIVIWVCIIRRWLNHALQVVELHDVEKNQQE